MPKTITLTDKQADELAIILKNQLLQRGLEYGYATRLNQLIKQIQGDDDFFLADMDKTVFDPQGCHRSCNVCDIVDPEVIITFDGNKCPLHNKKRSRHEALGALFDLFQVAELAAVYMPGELAEQPDKVMDALARAQIILDREGLIDRVPLHQWIEGG